MLARGVEKTSLALIRVYSHLNVLRTIIRAKYLDELTAVYAAAELSPQILSFLERVWIDAY